ncbi:MAG: DUF4136 domain-containing protein [Thermodesulfobacteriota bacterium]|nr:DUF4136 domain-containing protein [Thermodesulfobacteriota bacterium]
MQKLTNVIFLSLLVVFVGCSGIEVSQDYDVTADFSHWKTFDWYLAKQKKTGDLRVDNPLLDSRIRKAVDRSLAQKGFRRIFKGIPDFYVGYKYAIFTRIGSERVRSGIGFRFGGSGSFGGIGIGTGTDVRGYDEGMLVIDITDTQNKKLLWRGTGTRRVSRHSDPKKITKQINQNVEKILAQFPPHP